MGVHKHWECVDCRSAYLPRLHPFRRPTPRMRRNYTRPRGEKKRAAPASRRGHGATHKRFPPSHVLAAWAARGQPIPRAHPRRAWCMAVVCKAARGRRDAARTSCRRSSSSGCGLARDSRFPPTSWCSRRPRRPDTCGRRNPATTKFSGKAGRRASRRFRRSAAEWPLSPPARPQQLLHFGHEPLDTGGDAVFDVLAPSLGRQSVHAECPRLVASLLPDAMRRDV